MNEDSKSIMRREQIRTWSLLLLLMGVGAVLAWGLRSLLPVHPPSIVTGLLFLLPAALFLFWPRRAGLSDLRLLPLRDFVATPDVIFTPNQPQRVSALIAAWLSGFAEHHGPNAVLIGIQPDEPHVTDTVFLVGALSADDIDAARKFGANTHRVSRADFTHRFPSATVPNDPIHELVWD
jgi:uncharacterized membrane protein YfcA